MKKKCTRGFIFHGNPTYICFPPHTVPASNFIHEQLNRGDVHEDNLPRVRAHLGQPQQCHGHLLARRDCCLLGHRRDYLRLHRNGVHESGGAAGGQARGYLFFIQTCRNESSIIPVNERPVTSFQNTPVNYHLNI